MSNNMLMLLAVQLLFGENCVITMRNNKSKVISNLQLPWRRHSTLLLRAEKHRSDYARGTRVVKEWFVPIWFGGKFFLLCKSRDFSLQPEWAAGSSCSSVVFFLSFFLFSFSLYSYFFPCSFFLRKSTSIRNHVRRLVGRSFTHPLDDQHGAHTFLHCFCLIFSNYKA